MAGEHRDDLVMQSEQWRRQLPGAGELFAAVNISGRQLVAPEFPDVVEGAVRASGIDASAVSLEVTETILMDQPGRPTDTLRRLSALGVELSIDDFGTGYSSLSYLRWLSASSLKIDRTFIQEIGRGPHAATIIELVLGMAETLKLSVVAEGVETSAQANELRQLGVRLGQGYFWSKPMPPELVPEWMAGHAGPVPGRVSSSEWTGKRSSLTASPASGRSTA